MHAHLLTDVNLERRLLDPSRASCELDEETIQQLADAIGDKWTSIALFTTAEIEQIRSEDWPAQAMLQKLTEKGIVTFEQLCCRLQTISLLNPTICMQPAGHFSGQFKAKFQLQLGYSEHKHLGTRLSQQSSPPGQQYYTSPQQHCELSPSQQSSGKSQGIHDIVHV